MESTLHAVCTSCSAVNRIPAVRIGKEINCGKCHLPLFGSAPQSLDKAAFETQIARNDVPVIVDFWAMVRPVQSDGTGLRASLCAHGLARAVHQSECRRGTVSWNSIWHPKHSNASHI